MDELEIANERLQLAVSLAGGAISRFDLRTPSSCGAIFSRGVIPEGASNVCFPLIPFGNRLRGNAFDFDGAHYQLKANTAGDPHYLHGDAWLEQWQLVRHTCNALKILRHHRCDDSPYIYEAEQTFRLDDSTLTISMSVVNRSSRRLPYGLGLHPFLPLTRATRLAFKARRYWEQDQVFLPVASHSVGHDFDFSKGRTLPRKWMNTEFEGWTGHAAIMWPETGRKMTVSADPVFTRCMIFVSDRNYDPTYGEDYFCFEPMTHSVDGHHRADLGGLVPLSFGDRLAGSCSFTIETVPQCPSKLVTA